MLHPLYQWTYASLFSFVKLVIYSTYITAENLHSEFPYELLPSHDIFFFFTINAQMTEFVKLVFKIPNIK